MVIGLVAALAAILLGGLGTWVRRARYSRRTIEVPASERSRLIVGDVMRKHVITSGGLARLEVFDWGIRIRGMMFSRWLVATWEARFEELAIAELVATPHSRIAVWFRLSGEPGGGTAFQSTWYEDILGIVERRGVPVNRSVTIIRAVGELYGAPG